MDGVPAKCPTCSTVIPEGAVRCPGCGRVFGEDNRCPHCNAIAAVKPGLGGFVCLACGKPRERLPNTTVLGEPDGRASLVPLAPERKPTRHPLEVVGAATTVAGTLALGAALALFGTSGVGLLFAAIVTAFGVGGGVGLYALGRGRRRAAIDAATRSLDRQILALAAKRNGDLTAADVSKALHVDAKVAEAALMKLSNGSSIEAEVNEDVGELHFIFHEHRPAAPPKTRVAEIEDEPAEEEVADARAKAKRSAE